jgi:Ser/Thr protein kinase RdoA (MazF antagonist)
VAAQIIDANGARLQVHYYGYEESDNEAEISFCYPGTHGEAIMPEPSFVADVARTLYGFEPQSIESLDQYQFDWRGIYRGQDAQDGVWVMRFMHLPDAVDSFTHTARLLDWLTQHEYPAPSVRVTIDQQRVGVIDGWAITILSYVDGSVLGTSSADDLGDLAQTVGRLHSLHVDNQSLFAQARGHPNNIATAAQQLASYGANVPPAFQALATNLHASMRALQHLPQQLCITHGDCWYQNAIKTSAGQVTLIDWDNAGVGLPLLDLGNLLLTAHFDLSQPLVLEPHEATIKAMMHGYQQQRQIVAAERACIADAMRFLLAFQLGSYAADNTLAQHADFPFVLEKLQARYQATQPIAEIAAQYFV